ncbi:hypothetical protein tb265_40270 [Gemmatimonadetes bacterium T265]|nr:hypothetical protein tb265_40270 [Gemmatimonadetes bacterium T265]
MDRVWRAYTPPEAITRWTAASDDGHTTRTPWPRPSTSGRAARARRARRRRTGARASPSPAVTRPASPPERLASTFGDRAAEVTFDAAPGRTRVRVTFDAEATHPVAQQRAGWQAILPNFTRDVEDGETRAGGTGPERVE